MPQYNKLVRDRIPEIIEQSGKSCKLSTLSAERFLAELKRKLLEEATEAQNTSNDEDLLRELADVLEVITTLAEATGIGMAAVEDTMLERAAERGRFEKRLFLHWVDEHEGSPYHPSP